MSFRMASMISSVTILFCLKLLSWMQCQLFCWFSMKLFSSRLQKIEFQVTITTILTFQHQFFTKSKCLSYTIYIHPISLRFRKWIHGASRSYSFKFWICRTVSSSNLTSLVASLEYWWTIWLRIRVLQKKYRNLPEYVRCWNFIHILQHSRVSF